MSSFRRNVMLASAGNGTPPYDIIMTSESNPQVLSVCYAQGWCANPNYMTATEASAVTTIGTTFRNTSISHFDEFEYFTGITSLDSYAFACASLRTIKLPDTVTTIGTRAFNIANGNLRYISIGRGVASINGYAFSGQSKLTKVKFNGKPSCMYQSNLGLVAAYMYYVKEFESDVYTVIDDVLYNGTTLLAYPPAKPGTDFSTPSFVTSIYGRAFQQASSLRNLVINEGCTSLGPSALQNSSLRTLDLPSTLTTLGNRCIYQINYLYSITSRAMTAPNTSAEYALQNLGSSASQAKVIYVPSGATGYNAGRWGSLISSGWTLEEF